jgi:4-amino-4-deoxy-L-arabinose transferase-like glycosyltransferase
LFFFRLADRDLWSSHEARAAQDAQTILDEGAWGLPRLFDRRPELQKPPLYYWCVAATARLLRQRVDSLAVRLPAAVAALLGVAALIAFGIHVGRRDAAVAGSLVLATALHYTWLARTGRIDMPLTLTCGVALAGLYLARRANRARPDGGWGWLLMIYLVSAAGLLLKGPIGLVLTGAVWGVYLLVEGELPAPWDWPGWAELARRTGIWWGVPLIVALAGPWYGWAIVVSKGSFFETFVLHHNIDRGFGSDGSLRAYPWWFYAPRLAADFLPWTPLLIGATWYCLRRSTWRHDPEARFGLVWLTTMLVVLSCLRFKRADYLLPAYPGAALFVGCTLERWRTQAARPRILSAALGLVALGVAGGWCWYVEKVLPEVEPSRECRRFADEIRRRAPAPALVLFFRAECHPLAFHVGPPVDTFLEWENLNVWAGRPGTYYIVMPPGCADSWREHVTEGELEEVLRSCDLPGAAGRQRPLVLMRTRPRSLEAS